MPNSYMGRQTPQTIPTSSSFPPAFNAGRHHHMVQKIPLTSWCQLSQMCPLPTSCQPPAQALCKPFSTTAKTSVCFKHGFSQQTKVQHHIGCCEAATHIYDLGKWVEHPHLWHSSSSLFAQSDSSPQLADPDSPQVWFSFRGKTQAPSYHLAST